MLWLLLLLMLLLLLSMHEKCLAERVLLPHKDTIVGTRGTLGAHQPRIP
jgi:hypothetical protein